MSKRRIKIKKGILKIVVNSKKGQHITERELYSINNGNVKGLLKIGIEQKGTSVYLCYDVNGYLKLKDYLAIPLSKRTFAKMLDEMVIGLKAVLENYLNMDMLLLDLDLIMVDPVTQKIYFVYAPIQPYDNTNVLKVLFQDILKYSVFQPGQEHDYVRRYLEIVNNSANFSLFEMEEFVCEMLGKNVCVKTTLEENNDDTKLQMPVNAPAYSYDTPEDNLRYMQTVYEQPISDNVEFKEKKVLTPWIVRMSTTEKKCIDKNYFKIGKDFASNEFVVNNDAISRNHAAIVTEDSSYYIVDLNSTNKTSINGRYIISDMKVEIFSGTIIKMANEEFQFLLV